MNQSNLISNQEIVTSDARQTGNAFRVAVIMLIAGFIVEAFYLFLAWQMGAWQMFALAGVIAVFCALNIAAIPVIRKGQSEIGIWLIIAAMLLVFPAASALVSNIGPILGGAVIILTLIVASQALPRSQVRTAAIASLIAGGLAIVFDFIGLDYRLFVPQIQVFIPIITVVILLAVLTVLFLQNQQTIDSRLQLKITVWMGAILAFSSIILISYSVITSRQEAIRFAEAEALGFAEARAARIRAESEIPLNTARALAQALTAIRDPEINLSLSREQVNAMLRQMLIENPQFLGTYTLWEANAFDGMDESFRNKPAHDETGRFIPYWVRTDDGSIEVIALEQYETPGIGNWYLFPRLTKQEVTVAPLIYPIQGIDTVMASFVAPVIYENTFYGIVGVDAPIEFAQEIVDTIDLYDGTAQAILLTESGILISVSGQPELVNQPASEIFADFINLQRSLRTGEAFISMSPDGQFLRVFSPVIIGQTQEFWAFVLIIPFAKITQQATFLALQQIAIGTILTLIALALLWFLSNQIVRPLRNLTDIAVEVARGNLNITAKIDSKDETGVLANTFNLMISQLQNLFGTLEQRVADRTRGLELAAEVGRSVSEVRELDIMLKDAAEIIRSRFDLYYVQVYLTDASQTNLVLQSGTGSVGAALVERSHRLPLNATSINGRAAVEKQSVVVEDTATSPTFRPNPLLPDTRSEMAVPLLLGERLVGVLNLQSSQANALNQENLTAFEALAGQLAIAIQNANFLAETEEARAEVEKQARRLVRTGWQDYLDAIHRPEHTGFVFEQNKVTALDNEIDMQEQTDSLSAPIALTGEQLGSLVVEIEQERQSTQTVELVNIVARQVAQQIENLRLLESAERYRLEAEQAARRLTREGWQEYFSTKTGQTLSYLYDLKEVRPYEQGAPIDTETTLDVPIKVRDEIIGKLAVLDFDSADPDALELINTVSERLSEHIEGLRLIDQTQIALLQTEKLSAASLRFAQATDLQELVEVAVNALSIPGINRAFLDALTFNAVNEMEKLTVLANWWNGSGHEPSTVGTSFLSETMPTLSLFAGNEPVFFSDTHDDPRIDPTTLEFLKQRNIRALASLPLFTGTQQIGALLLESEEPHVFLDDEIRLFAAMGPQVATVLENRRQFERAQRQAEREAMLNAISQKIQGATSVEAVLQIAARELGHALGAPRTIAQLSMKDK